MRDFNSFVSVGLVTYGAVDVEPRERALETTKGVGANMDRLGPLPLRGASVGREHTNRLTIGKVCERQLAAAPRVARVWGERGTPNPAAPVRPWQRCARSVHRGDAT